MSSKVSLLRALRRQKKEGERKARGERRRRPIVVARTSSLRRFFRRHGVVHVPYVTCFCEDTWRKKFFFWSTNSQKPKAIVYPPPQVSSSLSKTRKRSTKDSRPKTATMRESKVSTYLERSSRSIIRSQKKRKKRKEKGPPPKREKLSNFTHKRLFLSSILLGVKLWTHKNTPHYKTLFERRTTQNTQPSSKWRTTQNQWLNSPR